MEKEFEEASVLVAVQNGFPGYVVSAYARAMAMTAEEACKCIHQSEIPARLVERLKAEDWHGERVQGDRPIKRAGAD